MTISLTTKRSITRTRRMMMCDGDEYVSDDDVNEEVSRDAAEHFGPLE
jgi:hypothetical protein